MKTYSTIQEAFLNQLGDVFFAKGNQYTCVHRIHVETHKELLKEGFIMLSYQETLLLAQLSEKSPMIQVDSQKEEVFSEVPKAVVNNHYNGFCNYTNDAYEFSDADPGL